MCLALSEEVRFGQLLGKYVRQCQGGVDSLNVTGGDLTAEGRMRQEKDDFVAEERKI